MIDPISSNLSSIPSSVAQTQPIHPAPAHHAEETKAQVAEQPAVNIELSSYTQARILEGQGSTVAEIALELKLDELTVRSYLTPIA